MIKKHRYGLPNTLSKHLFRIPSGSLIRKLCSAFRLNWKSLKPYIKLKLIKLAFLINQRVFLKNCTVKFLGFLNANVRIKHSKQCLFFTKKLFGGQSPKIRVRVFPVFDCDQKLQNKLEITLKRKKDNRTKMPVNKKVIIFKEQKFSYRFYVPPKLIDQIPSEFSFISPLSGK